MFCYFYAFLCCVVSGVSGIESATKLMICVFTQYERFFVCVIILSVGHGGSFLIIMTFNSKFYISTVPKFVTNLKHVIIDNVFSNLQTGSEKISSSLLSGENVKVKLRKWLINHYTIFIFIQLRVKLNKRNFILYICLWIINVILLLWNIIMFFNLVI